MKKLLLAALLIATTHTFAYAQEGAEDPQRSAVLNRFIGTWDMEVIAKPAGGEETTEKAVETRNWTDGGKVIHFEKSNAGDQEFHMLVTYSEESETFPGVLMFGTQQAMVVGVWDEKNSTMTFSGQYANGNTFVFRNRFDDANTAESKGTLRDARGNLLVEITYKQNRRPK